MLQAEDLVILTHLRINSRKPLTQISKETGMPVSTIFDRVARLEGSAVKSYTALLDFKAIGHPISVCYAIRSRQERRQELALFLSGSRVVNMLCRINNGFDFLAECVFTDLMGKSNFEAAVHKLASQLKEFHMLEELKREGFLPVPQVAQKCAGRKGRKCAA